MSPNPAPSGPHTHTCSHTLSQTHPHSAAPPLLSTTSPAASSASPLPLASISSSLAGRHRRHHTSISSSSSSSQRVPDHQPPPSSHSHPPKAHPAMASTASFSPSSNHRHSSLSQSIRPGHGPLAGTLPSLSRAPSFAPSISSLAVAAAGDSLRPPILDESALSPDEYGAYIPALLSLRHSQSEIDGLYDEQSALQYLREKCKLQLKDEAMILALFERTPLGIQPGHFFAWLRLVSWVQQGQAPSKRLLFTQTQPAQTFIGAPSGRGATRRASNVAASPMLPSFAEPSESAHASDLGYRIAPQGRHTSRPSASAAAGIPSSPMEGVASSPRQRPAAKLAKPRPRVGTQQPAAPTTAEPSVGPTSSNNPFRNSLRQVSSVAHGPEPSTASVQPAPAPNQPHQPHHQHHQHHHTSRPQQPHQSHHHHHHHHQQAPVNDPAQAPPLPHQPVIRGPPAPSTVSSANTLPLDALIGHNPAPNPFKQSKPRLVRPTPVVAGSRRPVSHTFGDTIDLRDRERELSMLTPAPGWQMDDSHSYAGYKQSDRLGVTQPSRAPISPLIQAGLDAASEVQRAKQALPPKTYTTIQRSAVQHPSPLKPKATRPGQTKKAASGPRSTAAGTSATGAGPKLLAPQPRRAAAGTDLSQPRKKASSRSEYLDEDDLHSMRSMKSKRSHRIGAEPRAPPGAGDLLGSHLASLGAGGRPKSRGALLPKLRSPADEVHPDSVMANSTAGSVTNWLREQDAFARARHQSEHRRTSGVAREAVEDEPQSKSPTPGSSASSISAVGNGEDSGMLDVAGEISRPCNPFDARHEEPRPPPSSLAPPVLPPLAMGRSQFESLSAQVPGLASESTMERYAPSPAAAGKTRAA